MRALHEKHEMNTVPPPGRAATRTSLGAYWPWALVGGAWGAALLATLTNHSELINHDYLLEHSGLPWLAALAVFLACWQVMTAAMMVPSSLPILQRDARIK